MSFSVSKPDSAVLLSWIARNNDPYRRQSDDDEEFGPTLTLLFDDSSPFAGRVDNVVLLVSQQDTAGDSDTSSNPSREAAEETKGIIKKRNSEIEVHLRFWKDSSDPTDHKAIYSFLRRRLDQVRLQFPNRKLLINVSPGTPAMHTVWMLMAETGMVDEPFSVVKTVPAQFRNGGPSVRPARIGIDTFYKAYSRSEPESVSSEEDRVFWDPKQFNSDALRSTFDRARRYSRLKVPILILGERGTGKTTLANWIRNSSPFRREKLDDSWPSVPCGQYEPETMRSELFGYVEGAFTGAHEDTKGLLHRADGDTLFLDEIGDVSPDLQRLLIRALEDKQFFRVGARSPEESDFRLITATNRPEEELTERLDADFLDRVSTFTLRMPPLREIPEEIPWLWKSVYEEARARSGFGAESSLLSDEDHRWVAKQLNSYTLPGNLRDLFRLAYLLISLEEDPEVQALSEEICRQALEEFTPSTDGDPEDLPREVARRFAEDDSLRDMIISREKVSTDKVFTQLKGYLAREIRRVANQQDQSPDALTDVVDKTLRNWIDASDDQ